MNAEKLATSVINVTVEAAYTQQISSIVMLAHRIWPIAYAGVLTSEQISNMLNKIYSPQNLFYEMAVSGHRFWVAYYNDKPAGFISAYKQNDTIWIKKIYVLPAVQGKGVGKALMETAINAHLPAKEVRLCVNRGNSAAHRFYQGIGFANIGEMPVQMGDYQLTDFIFSKPLTQK